MQLFRELDREWARLASSRGARTRLEAWARDELALRYRRSLNELVATIRAGRPEESDGLLAALVRLAADDVLAARAVLQSLVPGLRVLARTYSWVDDADEVDAIIVGAAWERIRTYKLDRRPRRIAANIVLDTRKVFIRATRCDNTIAPAQATHKTADESLLALLIQAVSSGEASLEAANLVARTRLGDETLSAVATRDGVSLETLRQRRHRVERRLATLVV